MTLRLKNALLCPLTFTGALTELHRWFEREREVNNTALALLSPCNR